MTRIPQITDRDDVPPDKRHIFDEILESRGRLSGPFPSLLNSPEVAGRVAHLGAYVRFESALSPQDRELAIITAAREFDCAYVWSAHAAMARQAGVREEAIAVIGNRSALDSLSDDEGLVVQYGRELLRDHKVTDATFESAKARYGDQGITELTTAIGYYGMLSCVVNAFGLEPGPDATPLP